MKMILYVAKYENGVWALGSLSFDATTCKYKLAELSNRSYREIQNDLDNGAVSIVELRETK